VSEDEYYEWFRTCGFARTGEATALTEEWVNDRGTYIMVPRPSTLSEPDRVRACEEMSRYFGWKSSWGAH